MSPDDEARLRTVIVRLFTAQDASTAGRLHGLLEVPGGPSTRFACVGELVAVLPRLAGGERTTVREQHRGQPALSPPEGASGG